MIPTSAVTTLDEARRRGVNLAERDGRLAVDSPREAFTAELRDALVVHKAEILGLLRSEAERREEPPHSWPPRPKELARWPRSKRERWGRRANQLEDEGLDWRAAEEQAYREVAASHTNHRQAHTGPLEDA